MRVLIVDDELALLEQLRKTLENQRYSVVTAADGRKALDRLFETTFDAIVLDIMMPQSDGLTVLKKARAGGIKTPILLLKAKNAFADRIKGLDSGADDYLPKSFSTAELLARLRALLRRSQAQPDPLLKIFDLQLETVSRNVCRGGEIIALMPREFSILEFLLYNKDRAVSRFSLAEHVWGDDFDSFKMSNFMDVYIKNLRQKIRDTGPIKIIQTIRGGGYIIREPEQ